MIDILPCHMIYYQAVILPFKSKAVISICIITCSAAVGWPVAAKRCPCRLRRCPAGVWLPDSSPVPSRHCSTCKVFYYFCRSEECYSLIPLRVMGPDPELVPGFADPSCSDWLSIFFLQFFFNSIIKADPAISYRSLFDATIQ